jgi:hypothetical protein
VRFLDTTCSGSRFARSFGGELLARSLASGRFTGSLLSAGHFSELHKQRMIKIMLRRIPKDKYLGNFRIM